MIWFIPLLSCPHQILLVINYHPGEIIRHKRRSLFTSELIHPGEQRWLFYSSCELLQPTHSMSKIYIYCKNNRQLNTPTKVKWNKPKISTFSFSSSNNPKLLSVIISTKEGVDIPIHVFKLIIFQGHKIHNRTRSCYSATLSAFISTALFTLINKRTQSFQPIKWRQHGTSQENRKSH